MGSVDVGCVGGMRSMNAFDKCVRLIKGPFHRRLKTPGTDKGEASPRCHNRDPHRAIRRLTDLHGKEAFMQ